MEGTVKFFNIGKGYGFIVPALMGTNEPPGQDLFFHENAVRGGVRLGCEPYQGQRVRYAAGTGRDGRPRAAEVELIW